MGHFTASSSLEKPPSSAKMLQNVHGENLQSICIDDRDISSIGEGIASMLKTPYKSSNYFPIHQFSKNSGKLDTDINGNQWESSLFSSSFSDAFNRNGNRVISRHSVKVASSFCDEEEPFESEDIEANTIGNLLPAEDDLFNGVSCEFGRATGGDELEDFDLFSSGGGLELEGDDNFVRVLKHGGHGGISFRHRDSTGCINKNYVSPPKCFLEQTDSVSRETTFGVTSSRHIGRNPSICVENPPYQGHAGSFMDHHLAGVTQNISSPFSGGRQVPLHPHSLPEYHDNLTNGFHFNPINGIGEIPNHMASGMCGGLSNTSVRGAGPTGRFMAFTKVSGSPVEGNSSPGHHLLWNKTSSDWRHVSNQMIWPNSPSFVHNVSPHHATGFSRLPVLLPPPPLHHVGSAPNTDPSLWDTPNFFAGEINHHLGSLGNTTFPLRSPPHLASPHRINNNFPGRNLMISVPTNFDSSSDRGRTFPQRKTDSNSNPCDRKQYELDIDRIMKGEDTRTTLMIKNIPNKYTSKMLLAAIDEHCRGTYDFIYLPIDFKNKCNVGYAFINMIDAKQIIPFHNAFNGKKWEKFNSEKVTNLAYARIQGKAALVAHFQNSSLMNEDKRCRPILFRTNGPNAGDPEPFPVGSNVRLKIAKSRCGCNEDKNPSNIVTSEDLSNSD